MNDAALFTVNQPQQQCPLCQQPLVIRSGKNGPFLGCSTYPACDYIKALHQHETTIVKVLDSEACPQCGAALAVKNGRYGMFIGCTQYPDCHFTVHDEQDTTGSAIDCPQCKKAQLTERISKFGKHFFGCERYPQCRFLVNDTPVVGQCVHCKFGLLVQKKTNVFCADKSCGKKQPTI